MAGYSATPLEQKLGLKPGQRVAILGAPADFVLAGVDPFRRLAADLDLILCFVRWEAELRRRLPRLESALVPAGSLWIAWPKRSSGEPTDLGEQQLRALILPGGLVDNKVCAIDATWSGLRFVVRLEHRAAWGAAPAPSRPGPGPAAASASASTSTSAPRPAGRGRRGTPSQAGG